MVVVVTMLSLLLVTTALQPTRPLSRATHAPVMATTQSQAAPRTTSCSCGSVVLNLNAPVIGIAHCHCAGCRAATGAAFSTWGCVPLFATHFSEWSTLKLYRRQRVEGNSPMANRYFCSECGCSVAMNYPASGRWPEPNTLWLSAAFLGDDAFNLGTGDGVIHMYPEERPSWTTIDQADCDPEQLTYMGGDAMCVVREEPASPVLILGGRSGEPDLDPAKGVMAVPPSESFRLRGAAPVPRQLPGSAAIAEASPAWLEGGGPVKPPPWLLPEGSDFRVRSVQVAGAPSSIAVFEVANPTDADGCDLDSPRASLCGGVLWPGARSAAEALTRHNLKGARVVEIGAGTGLVSLVAASLGAADALATDASIATLELVEATAASHDLKAECAHRRSRCDRG